MNKHQHHRLTAQGQRDPVLPEQQYTTDFFGKNNASPPKKANNQTELLKDFIGKSLKDETNRLSNEQVAAVNLGPEDRRFKSLIIDAISSADRAIKAILPYGHIEIQKYCSVYFLNKEKLLAFLDANNRSFFSNSDRNSKKGDKRKAKRKGNGSSDLTEMVPINHLERLQKIVYHKIIPILQSQFETEKQRGQKLLKKGKEWGNSDLRQGLQLLQRLNDKEKIAIDECAQLLQKFIVRVMQKQQKMLSKINRMKEKLDEQIKKTQALSVQSKKWEQHRAKAEKQWNKQKKNMIRYQQFSKQVRSIFTEKEKLDSEASQKQCLEDILQQLKRMLNNEQRHSRRQKKCDHKNHKETHASCKDQANKNEQQIKSLKQVVKSLDNQICLLRQQFQNMDAKLQHSNQKVSKFESKSKKIIEENDSMNRKIEEMMKDQSYKSKLIQQYLTMIAKLEDNLKQSEDNFIKLNEQNDSYLETIAKHSSEKQDFLKHMMESEGRQKELLQVLSKRQTDCEELVHNLNAKEKEILDGQAVIQKLYKQIGELYRALKEKEYNILTSAKQIQVLTKKVKELELFQLTVQTQNNHKNDILINNHKEQIHVKLQSINIQTLQSIQSPISPIKQQTSHILSQQLHQKILKNISERQNIKDAPSAQKETYVRPINTDENMFLNKKGEERPDFISAGVNKQTEQLLQRQREKYYSHSLKDDIEHVKEASNIEVNSHNQKSKNQDIGQFIKVEEVHIEYNHEQYQKKIKDYYDMKISLQLNTIQAESQKIQQLLDLNHRIGEHFNFLKQKIETNEQYKAETIQIKDELEGLTMMLNMCKLNTLQRLQKIAKAEILHHQAQEEIQRLKHRLDDALIANQSPFSNIQQNSDGSGFTIPDHLQSFFKNNTAVQQTKLNQQYHISRNHIKHKLSNDFLAQIDEEVQTINPPNVVVIESEVVIQTSWPIISLVEEKQQEASRSLINQLEEIQPVMPVSHTVVVVDSLSNTEEVKGAILPNSLKETPIEKEIGAKISVFDVSPQKHESPQIVQTPQRNPLANSGYFQNIMNAPQKFKNEVISSDKSFIQFRHETQIQQMKEMFKQREQHFSELVVERQQEIQRLKSIIKTLTKAQEVEERASPKNSRNKQNINRQIQNLKTENEQLWMFLQKERSEIERLQILIKQYQLHDELSRLKSVHHDYSNNHSQVITLHSPINENQGFLYAMTPAKRADPKQKEIAEFQAQDLSQSQHLQQLIQNEAIVEQQKNVEVEKEAHSRPQQADSPSKKFTRKSQNFSKQQSPRQRRHTSPKTTVQFDWQELVPQYFGKSPGKRDGQK